MDRAAALDRIRKCLALAASSEPHEAAAALRQAQALMRKHAISRAEAELCEASARAGTRSLTPPAWLLGLVNLVAEAFAVFPIYWPSRQRQARVRFIGTDVHPELAQYAFEVLARQLWANRRSILDVQPRRLKRTTRLVRADMYCAGWVSAVRALVERYAAEAPARDDVMRWLAARGEHTELVVSRPRVRMDAAGLAAAAAGRAAGAGATLHHGVGAGPARRQIEHKRRRR